MKYRKLTIFWGTEGDSLFFIRQRVSFKGKAVASHFQFTKKSYMHEAYKKWVGKHPFLLKKTPYGSERLYLTNEEYQKSLHFCLMCQKIHRKRLCCREKHSKIRPPFSWDNINGVVRADWKDEAIESIAPLHKM